MFMDFCKKSAPSRKTASILDCPPSAFRPVGWITIDHLCHHLVESVGNSVTISLTDFLGLKVCGEDREQLGVIPHSQEFLDGINQIAVVLHFSRFSANIVYT